MNYFAQTTSSNLGEERELGFWLNRKVAFLDERWSWPALPFASPRFMSALATMRAPGVEPKQQVAFYPYASLTADEIVALVERYAVTARRAEEAGFDGVQIHAAHGYLLSQFLSPLVNRRDDAWGGDERLFVVGLKNEHGENFTWQDT